MTYVAASIVLIASLVGVVLTILTLPGIWIMIGVAAGCAIWRPELFSIWTLVAAIVLGLIAELIEFIASAAGSKRMGGTRAGAWMSVLGGLVGAIVGTPIFPVIGTIVGAIVGAGVGAFIGERGIARRGWRDSAVSAGGAAGGRAVALVAKAGIAVAIAILLSVAAFVP